MTFCHKFKWKIVTKQKWYSVRIKVCFFLFPHFLAVYDSWSSTGSFGIVGIVHLFLHSLCSYIYIYKNIYIYITIHITIYITYVHIYIYAHNLYITYPKILYWPNSTYTEIPIKFKRHSSNHPIPPWNKKAYTWYDRHLPRRQI